MREDERWEKNDGIYIPLKGLRVDGVKIMQVVTLVMATLGVQYCCMANLAIKKLVIMRCKRGRGRENERDVNQEEKEE
jgi:hypothetical protein